MIKMVRIIGNNGPRTVFEIPRKGKISEVKELKFIDGPRAIGFTFQAVEVTNRADLGTFFVCTRYPQDRYIIAGKEYSPETPKDILAIYNALQEQLIEEVLR